MKTQRERHANAAGALYARTFEEGGPRYGVPGGSDQMKRSMPRPSRMIAMRRRSRAIACLIAAALPGAATGSDPQRPRNVIIFLGDAGGLPTLSAAGILAHDRPQSLFIQTMPHVGLSDTSARDHWVTD